MPLLLNVPGLSLAPTPLFPYISSIFATDCLWELQLFTSPAWTEGSMSNQASYCNHWPIPQPPFGPWPPFPQLWAQSFISPEPDPRGRDDSSSLGSQPLSQLKMQQLWLILLLLLHSLLSVSIAKPTAVCTPGIWQAAHFSPGFCFHFFSLLRTVPLFGADSKFPTGQTLCVAGFLPLRVSSI